MADVNIPDLAPAGTLTAADEFELYQPGETPGTRNRRLALGALTQLLDGSYDAIGSAAAALSAANIYTDDEISDLALVYLPLAGGEMSGDITFSQESISLIGTSTVGNDTQRLAISAAGSTSSARTATIFLHGINHPTNPGILQLNAGTGADLVLNPGSGGSCRPNSDNSRDLGSPSFRWANGYIHGLKLSGPEYQTGIITPAQITADQNNYTPTGWSSCRVARLSSDASRNITGLGAGTDGQRKTLMNVGGNDIVLTHNDSASTAANRIRCPGGDPFTIRGFGGVDILYDATLSRWEVVAP